MNQFLRLIKQRRWHMYPKIDWLEEGAIQGDALTDIRPIEGKLSVYKIDNDSEQRVITALAAARDCVSHIDYVVFEDSKLDSIGITVEQTDGNTPDVDVNKLHYDLGKLSVERLVILAQIISQSKLDRKFQPEVIEHMRDAINTGYLDKAKIKEKLLKVL